MCIFSREVDRVSATRIFARQLPERRQALVYEMTLSSREEVAMILPLPTPHDAGEDSVAFVAMDAYQNFFSDMLDGFAPPQLPGQVDAPSRHGLRVHSVGAFAASYVPSVADFDRLDPRFRMPDVVWAEMIDYVSYGFAVFQLKPGAEVTLHPMAFHFPSAEPDSLFFPTVHVHFGEMPTSARFDHDLFWQGDLDMTGQAVTAKPARDFMQLDAGGRDLTHGLVDGALECKRLRIAGDRPNQDTWVPAR